MNVVVMIIETQNYANSQFQAQLQPQAPFFWHVWKSFDTFLEM